MTTQETVWICKECKQEVTFINTDDCNTVFYKCPKHGSISEEKIEPKIVEVAKTKYEPPTEDTDLNILVQRLKEVNLTTKRFLKVNEEKRAFEKEWHNKLYTPEDLKSYPRWGICGRDNLVLVDVDNEEMEKILREKFPATFETISPRRKLPHFYFKVVGEKVQNKTLFLQDKEDGSGEIRSQNQYLVAPGTIITYRDLKTGEQQTGNYRITQNRTITTLTYTDFMNIVTPYLGKKSSQKLTGEIMRDGCKKGTRHFYGIKYASRLTRYERLDPIATLDIMNRWNQKNQPPMSDKEIQRIINNAVNYAQQEYQEDRGRIEEQVKKMKEEEELKNEIDETVEKWLGKETYHKFLQTIGYTVKRDKITKQFDFLVLISAFGDPLNELTICNKHRKNLPNYTSYTHVS